MAFEGVYLHGFFEKIGKSNLYRVQSPNTYTLLKNLLTKPQNAVLLLITRLYMVRHGHPLEIGRTDPLLCYDNILNRKLPAIKSLPKFMLQNNYLVQAIVIAFYSLFKY